MIKHTFLFVLLLIVNESEQILATQTLTFFIDSGGIGDSEAKQQNLFIHRQNFNQSTINYCNFDPFLLNNKRKSLSDSNLDTETSLPSNELDDFKVNLLMSNNVFNESSQITSKY